MGRDARSEPSPTCALGRKRYIRIRFPVPTFLQRRFVLLISLSNPQSAEAHGGKYVDEIMCLV
jgi:hypothetical protein